MYRNTVEYNEKLKESLKIDCKKCFGFCCVALYFSKSEGFPMDKVAGETCIKLQSDFNCSVHKNLMKKGLKGCTIYECFGAGQKVAQVTYQGHDWRENPLISHQMFDVFVIMRQIHEMLWYLSEAIMIQRDDFLQAEISHMINETIELTNLDPHSLIGLDIIEHRKKVNLLLLKTSELIRNRVCSGKDIKLKHKKTIGGRLNFIGANLKKVNLKGQDLSGALLIEADLRGVDLTGTDLIGADFRNTDLRGANLTNSIFITQGQINSAKGDINTKLPISLVRPTFWEK